MQDNDLDAPENGPESSPPEGWFRQKIEQAAARNAGRPPEDVLASAIEAMQAVSGPAAPLPHLLLAAEWTDDCQGKKDYDGDVLAITTRCWPASYWSGSCARCARSSARSEVHDA